MKGYTDEVLILESLSNELNRYDYESLKLVKEAGIMSVPSKVYSSGVDRVTEEYTNVLTTGIEQINAVAVDRTAMVNFFENIYNSDDLLSTHLTTPLKNTAEVEDVRPNYLESFLDTVNRTVAGISKGQVTKDYLKINYINPSYIAKTKRMLVKSTLTELDYRNLIETSNQAIPCRVTEEFFAITVLPFLRTYADEVKQMTIQGQRMISVMRRGSEMISDYMNTYNVVGITEMSDSTAKLMAYYLFNIARIFMEVSAYGSYMLARKMNAFSFNVNSLTELYRKIVSFFPENNASFHESVASDALDEADDAWTMGELMDGDASVLKTIAYQIRDQHHFSMSTSRSYGDKFHSVMDHREDHCDYDLTPYKNIEAVMTSIIKSVYIMEANCKDESLTFDELKEKAGLGSALINRFGSHVASISDIAVYTEAENEEATETIYYAVTGELRGFGDEMDKLARYVKDIHDHVDTMDDRLFNNINNEFQASQLIGETRKFVNDFKSDFQDLVTQIVQGFFRRLRSLDDYLNHLERSCDDCENEQQVETLLSIENEDFVKEAVLSGLEDDDDLYQELARLENARSYIRSLEKTYGVDLLTVVTEKEGDDQSQNTSQGEEKKDGTEKSPTPEVVNDQSGSDKETEDKEANQKDNDSENKDTEEEKSNDPEKKKASIKEMIKKMAEFFEEIIKKFLAAIDRQLEINKKWLANHKDELLKKRIQFDLKSVYLYADDMPNYVVENINACSSMVSGLTDDKINSMDNAAIDKALFGFITISADIPIRDKMTQWYTTKDREMTTVTMNRSEIKKRVPAMIDYCETFYNGLYNNIANALRNLKNAWKNKADSLQNANTEKVMYINKQIKYFAGVVLNCVRDRNYAYLKILKIIIGKTKNQEKETSENNNDTNEQKTGNNTTENQAKDNGETNDSGNES